MSVTNIDSSISASGASWTYTPMNPLMTGVTSTCANGASTGCTITVTGSNFEPGMRIIFTNPPLTLPATFVSSGQLTATLTTSFEAAGITYRTAACGTDGTESERGHGHRRKGPQHQQQVRGHATGRPDGHSERHGVRHHAVASP